MKSHESPVCEPEKMGSQEPKQRLHPTVRWQSVDLLSSGRLNSHSETHVPIQEGEFFRTRFCSVLTLTERKHRFIDQDVRILDREDGWFERGIKGGAETSPVLILQCCFKDIIPAALNRSTNWLHLTGGGGASV